MLFTWLHFSNADVPSQAQTYYRETFVDIILSCLDDVTLFIWRHVVNTDVPLQV